MTFEAVDVGKSAERQRLEAAIKLFKARATRRRRWRSEVINDPKMAAQRRRSTCWPRPSTG